MYKTNIESLLQKPVTFAQALVVSQAKALEPVQIVDFCGNRPQKSRFSGSYETCIFKRLLLQN
jgi:hypothetical protein